MQTIVCDELRALPTIQTGLAIRNFVGPIPRSISFNVWYVLYSEYVRVGIPFTLLTITHSIRETGHTNTYSGQWCVTGIPTMTYQTLNDIERGNRPYKVSDC